MNSKDTGKDKDEYTGGSVSYYRVPVNNPTNPSLPPYMAECNDIIRALKMNYAEGNAFKAIWRSCAARNLGLQKAGYKDGLYDAEKVVFFGQDMIKDAQEAQRIPVKVADNKSNIGIHSVGEKVELMEIKFINIRRTPTCFYGICTEGKEYIVTARLANKINTRSESEYKAIVYESNGVYYEYTEGSAISDIRA